MTKTATKDSTAAGERARLKTGRLKVLIADTLSEDGIALLKKEAGLEVDVQTGLSPADLAKIIGPYDALLVRSATKVTAEVIAKADRLKVIGRAGVGLDNVDADAATKRGIIVMNVPAGNTISTAEHTMSMLMALARRIPQAYASLKGGAWERSKFVGTELFGKTLGVVGLGKIGTEVAKRAQVFGMRVIAYDPFLSTERAQQLEIQLTDLKSIYAESDFITVHVPLTAETKHLIGAREIASMKKGVRLINCARGGIIDETALQQAVASGHVAGAAIDVFEQEPPPKDHPLRSRSKSLRCPTWAPRRRRPSSTSPSKWRNRWRMPCSAAASAMRSICPRSTRKRCRSCSPISRSASGSARSRPSWPAAR
jgi:D-3-phosphoglycerate dehydrogenase